jgi:hypothetical protein
VREVDSNGSDDDINISMDERALIVLFAAATDVDNAVADADVDERFYPSVTFGDPFPASPTVPTVTHHDSAAPLQQQQPADLQQQQQPADLQQQQQPADLQQQQQQPADLQQQQPPLLVPDLVARNNELRQAEIASGHSPPLTAFLLLSLSSVVLNQNTEPLHFRHLFISFA